MSVLIEINRLLRNCTSLTEVYDKVIEIVTRLLEAESAGIILYSEATNELILQKAAFEDCGHDLTAFRVPIDGEGNTVDVFQTGEPYISNDSHLDARSLKDYVKLFGVRNTAMVPLEVEGRRIGVLHVYNKKAGLFSKEDKEILILLASHLAVLIENAWLYDREKKMVEALSKLSEKTAAHQARLEKLLEIHNQLIGKVLSGDGLPAIINTLYTLLQAHVIVEDNQYQLIGTSDPLVDSRYSFQYLNSKRDGIRRSLQAGQIVRYFPYNYQGVDCTRIIAPIGEHNHLMGYLSVMMDPVRAESDLENVAIEQGAAVLALELMKDKIKSEVGARYRGEFLDDLISGSYGNQESFLQRAEFFGYNLSIPARVAIVSLENQKENLVTTENFDRSVCQKIKKDISGLLPNCFIARKKANLLILVPQISPGRISEQMVAFKKVRELLCRQYPKFKVSIGIGNVCRELQDYQKSYRQALKALAFTKPGLNIEQVVFYEELGIYGLLAEIKDQKALVEFVTSKIGPLLVYDPPKGQILVDTLEEYLKSENNIEETALKLHIHTGTVKYRLRRIREILNIDFNQTELFNLKMALQVKRLLNQ